MRNAPTPVLALTCLLALPAGWGCEAKQSQPDLTSESAPTAASRQRPALTPTLAEGVYLSELTTNLLPLRAELPNGYHSEGVGDITVRQLVRIEGGGDEQEAVRGCRAAPTPQAEAHPARALEVIADTAGETCAEVKPGEPLWSLNLRRECDRGGYAQLRMLKLPTLELAPLLEMGLTAGEHSYGSAECFEMFTFEGANQLYRDGQLTGTYPTTTNHITVGIASNAGDLELELIITGPLATTDYRWINPDEAAAAPAFQLQLKGDHPLTALPFTGGALRIEQLQPTLRLAFVAERADAAPLEGQLVAPTGVGNGAQAPTASSRQMRDLAR